MENNIIKTMKEKVQKDLDEGKFTKICSNETTFKKYVFLSHKALLESVVEMVEAEKHDDDYIICATCDFDECNANSALNNIIAHLKQSLSELEK